MKGEDRNDPCADCKEEKDKAGHNELQHEKDKANDKPDNGCIQQAFHLRGGLMIFKYK